MGSWVGVAAAGVVGGARTVLAGLGPRSPRRSQCLGFTVARGGAVAPSRPRSGYGPPLSSSSPLLCSARLGSARGRSALPGFTGMAGFTGVSWRRLAWGALAPARRRGFGFAGRSPFAGLVLAGRRLTVIRVALAPSVLPSSVMVLLFGYRGILSFCPLRLGPVRCSGRPAGAPRVFAGSGVGGRFLAAVGVRGRGPCAASRAGFSRALPHFLAWF